jgi:hypothetical protein
MSGISNLLFVLRGCETLREEHTCRVFGKRVLRNRKERIVHDFCVFSVIRIIKSVKMR